MEKGLGAGDDYTTIHSVARGVTKSNRQDSIEPLLLNAGDMLVRDMRCLHRGSPNTTDTPRVAAVIGVNRSWFWRGDLRLRSSPMPRSVWDGLSEREQSLFRHFKPYVEGMS